MLCPDIAEAGVTQSIRPRCSKAVGHHEAGHIFMATYYLDTFCEVIVLNPPDIATDEDGVESQVSAYTTGICFSWKKRYPHITAVPSDDELTQKLMQNRGFRHLLVDLAGPIAEARYSRKSFDDICEFGWGTSDLKHAGSTARFLTHDDEDGAALLRKAEDHVRTVLRSEWATIEVLAVAIRAGDRVTSRHPALAHVTYVRPRDRFPVALHATSVMPMSTHETYPQGMPAPASDQSDLRRANARRHRLKNAAREHKTLFGDFMLHAENGDAVTPSSSSTTWAAS